MIVKPSINFLTKFSGQKLAQAVATILAAMGGNLIYPLPFPTLLAISALLAAFIQAQADAANGGKGLTAIRNAAARVPGDILGLYRGNHRRAGTDTCVPRHLLHVRCVAGLGCFIGLSPECRLNRQKIGEAFCSFYLQ